MLCSASFAQFNPSQHTPSNKPYAPNGKPTDARSYYYDASTFSYRPFTSRAEILSYLNSTSSRTGNFPIFMDSAGSRYEYSFMKGTTDNDLVLKSSNDTRLDLTPEEDRVITYDPVSGKGKYAKAYLKSVKDLLYTNDTLGVKVVRSFHQGYNTGGFSVRFVGGMTADYVTSWPSKVFSGSWQRVDYVDILDIDKLGALGDKATRITAASLGYSSGDLSDLYGSLFTKATTDYIDVIAWNQAIKALGVTGKRYRWIQGGSNTYYINKNLERFANYVGSQVYDHFGVIGNNTVLQSYGGKYNAFTRIQDTYSGLANQAVSNRYTVKGVQFREFDTAMALNSAYSNTVQDNIFYRCNFSVILKWNLGFYVVNNRFEGYDSVGVYVGHISSFNDLSTATASAYGTLASNRFLARTGASKGIWIDEVNGVYLEQNIFEGGDPDYNIYIRFINGGGNFGFSTNTREMKIMGGHLENNPTKANIYFESGANKYLFIEKMYWQTPPIAPFLEVKGQNSGSRAVVVLNNMPYMDPGSGSMKMFKGEFSEWYFKNIPAYNNALQDTMYWHGGLLPEVLHVEANTASLNKPYIGSATTIIGNVTQDINGIFIGNQSFYGRLKIPEYTDSTQFSALGGNLYYHKDRNKFYGGYGTGSWRPFIDSITLYHPSFSATANGQTFTALNIQPTVTVGAFTGTVHRAMNYQNSFAGGTIEMRVANTSSSSNSRSYYRAESNNGGITTLWSDGRLITSGADLNIIPPSGYTFKVSPTNTTRLLITESGKARFGSGTTPTIGIEFDYGDAMLVPKGTTAQRPAIGVGGYFRFNNDSLALEFYNGTAWRRLASSQAVRDSSAQIRSSIPAQVNIIPGTNVTVTGTYPNITINSTGGGGGTSSETLVKVNDADYTITTGTGNLIVHYFNELTAARTVTLPAAADNTGRIITIKHGGAGTFVINFSANIYENSTTWNTALAQGASTSIMSDGTNWIKIR